MRLLMQIKKLQYYSNAVKVSQESYQEENFVIGLVKFIDNFNIFYNLIKLIEGKFNTECIILPSFNYQSQDEKQGKFLILNILDTTDIDIDILKESFPKLTYKEKEYSFDYVLDNDVIQIIIINI